MILKRKSLWLNAALVGSMAFMSTACAQEAADEKKTVKSEERVEISIINGEKKVVISSDKDGKTTQEILTGADAEKYISENEHVHVMHNDDDAHSGNYDISIDIDGDEFSSEEIQAKVDELIASIKTKTGDADGKIEKRISISIDSDGEKIDIEELLEDLDIDVEVDGAETKIIKRIVIEESDEKTED